MFAHVWQEAPQNAIRYSSSQAVSIPALLEGATADKKKPKQDLTPWVPLYMMYSFQHLIVLVCHCVSPLWIKCWSYCVSSSKVPFFNRLFLAISTVRLDIVSISFAFPQTALTVDCRQFQLSASSPNICLWFAKRRLDFNTLSLIHQNILNNLTSALHRYFYFTNRCMLFNVS